VPPSESQGKPPRVAVADPSGGTAHPRCCLFVVAWHLVLATRAAPHHGIAPTSLGGLTTSRARKSPVKRHPRAQVAMRITGRGTVPFDGAGACPWRRASVQPLPCNAGFMSGSARLLYGWKPQTCWYIRARRARARARQVLHNRHSRV
jgi:hypothetical protein